MHIWTKYRSKLDKWKTADRPDRQTDRQRAIEIETNKAIFGQTDKEIDKQKGKKPGRNTYNQREIERERQ